MFCKIQQIFFVIKKKIYWFFILFIHITIYFDILVSHVKSKKNLQKQFFFLQNMHFFSQISVWICIHWSTDNRFDFSMGKYFHTNFLFTFCCYSDHLWWVYMKHVRWLTLLLLPTTNIHSIVHQFHYKSATKKLEFFSLDR